MTPHELNIHIEEYIAAQEAKQKNEVSLAWLNAYYQRVKRMPDIKKVTNLKPAAKKQQTDEQMLERIIAMNKTMGGKEIKQEPGR